MELRKKMEQIYSKISDLGEDSVLMKPNEVRRGEYKNMKIEEEIKKAEENEKKGIASGLFSTEIR